MKIKNIKFINCNETSIKKIHSNNKIFKGPDTTIKLINFNVNNSINNNLKELNQNKIVSIFQQITVLNVRRKTKYK